MKTFKRLIFSALIIGFVSCGQVSANRDPAKKDAFLTTGSNGESIDTTKTLGQRELYDYIISAETVKPNATNGSPFDNLDYDKVIAYDFSGSEEPYPKVIKNGRFVPVITAQQYLSQAQADKILSALSSTSTYGEGTAACFQPHFALVLYKNNKMIHQISICLGCNYLISDIDIPAQLLKKAITELGDEYPLKGFSKKGKNAIRNLCKEINFTYGEEE
jgi:hypothetical protein